MLRCEDYLIGLLYEDFSIVLPVFAKVIIKSVVGLNGDLSIPETKGYTHSINSINTLFSYCGRLSCRSYIFATSKDERVGGLDDYRTCSMPEGDLRLSIYTS